MVRFERMRVVALAAAFAAPAALIGCGPKSPPAASASAPATIEPVFFRQGGAQLTEHEELMKIGQVAQRLREDRRLVVVLVGHTDPTGSDQANQKLSVARAEAVRALVMRAGGVEAERVLVYGQGEAAATGDWSEDRRVEFLFDRQLGKTPASADAIVAARAPAPKPAAADTPAKPGAAAAASGSGSAGAPAHPDAENIEPTGLADVDALFDQVQVLLDLVRGARGDVALANENLRAALGAGEGVSLEDALGDLKAQAAGSIEVKLKGGKPSIGLKPDASPQVRGAVSALNGLVASFGAATAKLATVPQQSKALIAQAKAIPSKLPTMLKDAGMGMGELPQTFKAVRHNLKLTGQVPKEAAAIGKEAATTFKAIGSAFG